MGASSYGTVKLTALSPGAGCACKLPLSKLEGLFASLGSAGLEAASGDLLIGAAEGDDAAVLRLDDERALILTTDFFTPIVDDPYDWGRIAATNALSDVYAMGGRPLMAVNLAAWPGDALPVEMLADVMRGGADAARAGGCFVVGGHTISDPVPKYGMAVVGLAHPDRLLAIDQVTAGCRLVLTKAIGTGVVSTGVKRGMASSESVAAAVASMTTLNAVASEVALAAGVKAATDVTGFGLLGHLHRMMRASGLAAEIHAASVPLLPGAVELVAAGFVPGGTNANISHLADFVTIGSGVSDELGVLMHDAQTSGGLLLAIEDDPDDLLNELRDRGVPAALVGSASHGEPGRVTVV